MADKIVNATKLDAALTYEAGKIREKTGDSANISFDLANEKGFGDAIEAIVTGGGSVDNLTSLIKDTLVSYESDEITNLPGYFFSKDALTSLKVHNVTASTSQALAYTSALTVIALPKITSIPYAFLQGSGVEICDFGSTLVSIDQYAFNGANSLGTLILRGTSVISLLNINASNGTKFSSGGTGGTIYIPEVLYNKLGNGSSLDYKAATNWSIIDSYGTITWAKIEGSIYETQYADGTPISS